MFRTASRVVPLALTCALLLTACARPTDDVAASRPPNVLLISIDSLRADHLGCYGYERDTSPAIDALAGEGVLFERAVAQAPWTLPSHASLLTSLYSRTHQTNDVKRRLPADVPTLAASFEAAGYATRAVVSGTFMQSRFGMDRGFQVYDDTLAHVSHRRSHEAVTSEIIHDRAMELLSSAPEPFFLFVHFWDVHYDYVPPPPFDTKFDPGYEGEITSQRFMKNDEIHAGMDPADLAHIVALYDGEIAWVYEHVDRMLDGLARRGLDERTIVVVTADHGDEFFEHGEKGHTHALYEEQLHVPLIVRMPGLAGGRRVAERVELIDVMPTLLAEAGLAEPPALQGRSLGPLLRGEPWEERPAFSETTKGRKRKDDELKSKSWCVYDGARKLTVFAGDRYPNELFDLRSDAGETNNLFDESSGAEALALYRDWLERIPEGEGAANEGVDEETLRQLRSLGYVGDD